MIRNNAKDIYIGLNGESQVRGALPGSAIKNADGKSLYSWRLPVVVRLSPDGLASTFNPELPWHDESHRPLRELPTSRMFGYGNCRAAKIVGLTGKDTAFASERSLEELPSNLIVLIEWRESQRLWYEPGDLDISYLQRSPQKSVRDVLGSGTFVVVFADGKVWEMREQTPVSVLLPFCSVASSLKANRNEELERWKGQ